MAARLNQAHGHLCGIVRNAGVGATFDPTRLQLRAILDGTAKCDCGAPATLICASTATSVFLCEEHAASGHAGCKNVCQLSHLEATVTTATLMRLKPDPGLLMGALFHKVGNEKNMWVVKAVDMATNKSEGWFVLLCPVMDAAAKLAKPGSNARKAQEKTWKKVSISALEQDYVAISVPTLVQRFFLIQHSWVMVQDYPKFPLYGLVHNKKAVHPLLPNVAKTVRRHLKSGSIDDIMTMLLDGNYKMQWLPHLSSLAEATQAKDHIAASAPMAEQERVATAAPNQEHLATAELAQEQGREVPSTPAHLEGKTVRAVSRIEYYA